ncbi:serine/threonine-protein kinase [Pendulispora albinea]|uniref:Serine/threonine protein kinase n=1 Tax=Pendulispora albinea TaxID=2741071 RepID=A0ABZ2M3V3_9BACT
MGQHLFFARCRHCGYAHPLNEAVCKLTGEKITPTKGLTSQHRRAVAPAGRSISGPRLGTLLGRIVGGKYRVLREIGHGGASTVYGCLDCKSGVHVALKVPLEEMAASETNLRRFYQEAKVIGTIRHHNVCAVIDTGQLENGVPYIVLELLRGESLQVRIERKGPLGFEETCAIGLQVLEALAFTHELKVIHRDIKPANVFLCEDQQVKVLDFGISRWLSQDAPQLTPAGRIMGTPVYLAPEQMKMEPIDGRVDIYAMGIVLQECLFGRAPFSAQTLDELLREILEVGPIPVRVGRRDVPSVLASVLERAVHRDRDQRFATAAEMYNSLRFAWSSLPERRQEPPPSLRRTLPASPLRNPPPFSLRVVPGNAGLDSEDDLDEEDTSPDSHV